MSFVKAAHAGRARSIILLLAAFVSAAMMALAWIDVARTRAQEAADAAERVEHLAIAIGTDLDRGFASIDVALGVIVERVTEPGTDILRHLPALVWFLHSIEGHLAGLQGIGLVDADGNVRVDTAPGVGARANVAHRRYYTDHRARSDAGLVIDGPIATADGTELMVFAQRLPARDGSFDGIARAAVTTDRLRALLARAAGADDPAVAATLLRDDGTIVMRTGRARATGLAAVPAEHPLRRAIAAAARGPLALADPVDDVARLTGFYRLRGQPFTLVVGVDRAATTERTAGAIVRDAVGVLLGVAAIAALAWWLIRAFGESARLAARLAVSEARFRDFAAASSDWHWEQDADLRFTFVSDVGGATFRGDLARDLYGKTRREANAPYASAADWARHEADLAARRAFRDFRLRRPARDGRICTVAINGVPIFDAAAGFKGYRGTGTDITRLVEIEEAKRTLEVELQQSQKLESLGTLAGGIAHDFNNALVPILALAQTWAKRADPDSRLQQDMTRVVAAARHSRDIVRKILAFSRREEGTLEPIDLAACVGEAVSLARLGVPPDIALAERYDGALTVLADRSQIVQIVTNMVANAVHAIAGSGSIAVAVALAGERERAAHDLAAGGPLALLRIADSGCGMDGATMARIFEPYFTTKPVGVGTGLGLAAVHGIVARHRGQIRVDSAPGAGTAFSIYLPLAVETRQAA
jgi:PAS domain S-box-containing protein